MNTNPNTPALENSTITCRRGIRRALTGSISAACAAVSLCAWSGSAHAADYRWQDTGSTWNTTDGLLNWDNEDQGGITPIAWANGNQASFAGTGTAIDVGTVTVSGMYFDAGSYTFNNGTITLTSNLINAGGSNATPGTVTVNSVIAGSVGLTKQNSYAGTLVLNGLNTYTGATTVGKGTLQINTIANSGTDSSLGKGGIVGAGAIVFAGTAGMTLKYTGASATTNRGFTVTNNGNIDVAAGQTLTMGDVALNGGNITAVSSGGGGTLILGNVTLGGNRNINTTTGNAVAKNFTMGAFNTIFDTGNAGIGTTVTGVVSGSGAVTKTGNGAGGYLNLLGANTYTGQTIIQRGNVTVSSLNSVNGGTPLLASSSLGAPTTVALGTIKLGNTNQSNLATLIYTGTGETTDRVIDLSGTTAGGALDQSGTGLLEFTSAFTATGNGAKTLTLQGSTVGTGKIAGAIVNSTGTTGLTKAGSGTWTLSGANVFTGTITVNGGSLIGTQTSGTPFGTGAATVGAAILSLAPTGSGADVAVTGGTLAAATKFTFNPGSMLSLNKGTQSSLTYTFGATGATYVRNANGTLILSVSAIANLGNTVAGGGERFLINGTAPGLVNTLVSGVVAQDRASSNAGDFVTYDGTDGFKVAAYTATDFTGSSITSVLNIVSASTTGATAAYAMRVSGTVTNAGNTITLGSGANTSGLILNGGTISGGTLTTPAAAAEFVIYTSGASEISSVIPTATGMIGMSVFGPGTLALTSGSANGFTGGLRININPATK